MFKVLVVDDSSINRRLARAVLKADRYEIDEAEDGFDAVDRLSGHSYDLVLLDIGMPGLDGFSVARKVRRTRGPNQATTLIAWTAYDDADLEAESETLDRCFDAVVRKPVSNAELRQVVASGLAGELRAVPAGKSRAA